MALSRAVVAFGLMSLVIAVASAGFLERSVQLITPNPNGCAGFLYVLLSLALSRCDMS
jgi:hypothetical protein